MPEYSLVCPFLDEDARYAAGVEFGMAYMELRRRPRRWKNYVTRANQDQFLLLASRLGYKVVEMEPWDDCWLWLVLRRNP